MDLLLWPSAPRLLLRVPYGAAYNAFGWAQKWFDAAGGESRSRVRLMSPVAITIFVLLSVFIAIVSARRGMDLLAGAALTGGFLLVMIPVAVVGEAGDGAMVLLAALGGGITQWGIDAHRVREAARG